MDIMNMWVGNGKQLFGVVLDTVHVCADLHHLPHKPFEWMATSAGTERYMQDTSSGLAADLESLAALWQQHQVAADRLVAAIVDRPVAAAADGQVADCEPVCSELLGQSQTVADCEPVCSELPGQSQTVADCEPVCSELPGQSQTVADCEPVCSELPGQCQAAADRRVAD